MITEIGIGATDKKKVTLAKEDNSDCEFVPIPWSRLKKPRAYFLCAFVTWWFTAF